MDPAMRAARVPANAAGNIGGMVGGRRWGLTRGIEPVKVPKTVEAHDALPALSSAVLWFVVPLATGTSR